MVVPCMLLDRLMRCSTSGERLSIEVRLREKRHDPSMILVVYGEWCREQSGTSQMGSSFLGGPVSRYVGRHGPRGMGSAVHIEWLTGNNIRQGKTKARQDDVQTAAS